MIMCCRLSCYPLDVEKAIAILRVGQFKPVYWQPNNPEYAVNWNRAIPEEGTTVTASIAADSLEMNISPAISVYAHHANKRITAGVYFEIAAKYAEQVGVEVIQRATVVGCKDGDSPQGLVIAHYPRIRLSYERVCPGFRAIILGDREYFT